MKIIKSKLVINKDKNINMYLLYYIKFNYNITLLMKFGHSSAFSFAKDLKGKEEIKF